MAQRIVTVPCRQFAYDKAARQRVRERLGWAGTDVVGVYVDKFGSIYYDEEAFQLFRTAADFFGVDFRLIILTHDALDEVQAKLTAAGLSSRAGIRHQSRALGGAQLLVGGRLCICYHQACALSAVLLGHQDWRILGQWPALLVLEGIDDDCDIIKQEGGRAVLNLDRSIPVSEALAHVAR